MPGESKSWVNADMMIYLEWRFKVKAKLSRAEFERYFGVIGKDLPSLLSMTNLIKRAKEIASKVHKNQKDKLGYPYGDHIKHVALEVQHARKKLCNYWLIA